MRSVRQTTPDLAWPSLRQARGRLLGLPFVLMAAAPGVPFGWRASLAGLMVASVASFVLFVPMIALALNGGAALSEDAPMPPLPPRSYIALLVLWSLAAWLGAGVVAARG
jgi:hypothetical protein